MGNTQAEIPVYLEIGNKRTLAAAIDWPGWCRSGRDQASALDALFDYAPRYERAIGAAGVAFDLPASSNQLVVTERLQGNATTDFGGLGAAPSNDSNPLDDEELARQAAILNACWGAFDAAAKAAEGMELRKGPRGGGRELSGIIQHVIDSNRAYLSTLGVKPSKDLGGDPQQQMGRVFEETITALSAAAAGELPQTGPRGGKRWTPRTFVRHVAWHVLDHAWEIEDRVIFYP